MNSWKDDGVTTSPWLHPEALPAIREALRLRLRLMPYLYSAMVLAHEAHVPVLAPTFFVFEDDPATLRGRRRRDVRPVPARRAGPERGRPRSRRLSAARARKLARRLDRRVHAAGRSARIAAPLDRLPLLAPAGAIVPMTDSGDDYFAPVRRAFARAAGSFPAIGSGANPARFSSRTTASRSPAPRPG